jgi:thiol-disulfide isomerase/thioredoxin
VDIVCQSVEDIDDALAHMMRIEKAHTFGNHKELIHFCLVPEYSVGEGFIHIMKKQVLSWAALGCKPIPRIMPQLHKLVYLVP